MSIAYSLYFIYIERCSCAPGVGFDREAAIGILRLLRSSVLLLSRFELRKKGGKCELTCVSRASRRCEVEEACGAYFCLFHIQQAEAGESFRLHPRSGEHPPLTLSRIRGILGRSSSSRLNAKRVRRLFARAFLRQIQSPHGTIRQKTWAGTAVDA